MRTLSPEQAKRIYAKRPLTREEKKALAEWMRLNAGQPGPSRLRHKLKI